MRTILFVCLVFVTVLMTVTQAASLEGSVVEGGVKRFLFDCNSRCSHGGCYGSSGVCFGVCYCYGSGYEYRCSNCDL